MNLNKISENKMRSNIYILALATILITTIFSQNANFEIKKITGEIIYAEDIEIGQRYIKLKGQNYNFFNNHLELRGVRSIKDMQGEFVWQNPKYYDEPIINTNMDEIDTIDEISTRTQSNVKIDKQFDNSFRPYWNFHNPKDPARAGLLNLFIPSGGHFYNEQNDKGIFYLFAVPFIYLVGHQIKINNFDKNDDDGVRAGSFIQLCALILHVYGYYDAILSANEINKEYYKNYKDYDQTQDQIKKE